MSRRPASLATATACVVCAALLVAGCEAQASVPPPAQSHAPRSSVVAPQSNSVPLPAVPPDRSVSPFDGLEARTRQATAEARPGVEAPLSPRPVPASGAAGSDIAAS